MKSRKGFLAGIIFPAAIPFALLCRIIFGADAEMLLHFALATGFTLISLAIFDFKIPKWLNIAGCFAAVALALIFLLQGVSQLSKTDSLNYLAFEVLGQFVEAGLVKMLLIWFAGLLFYEARGKTRAFGSIVMIAVLCVELYSYYLIYRGTSLDAEAAILKLVYLLPFVWLIFESKKKNSSETKDADLN
jgi:hypothetical protein